MNREDIIRMAREAGFTEGDISLFPDLIAHFATIIAAHEREACAKVCEEMDWCYDDRQEFAAAIRARGNK
jgi:hypothetical protein